MPQTVWSGTISWGLVSIPVAVQSAIGGEHRAKFHQYHAEDMGRVRYRKTCELDGRELGDHEIVRGVATPTGAVTLTDAELDAMPLPTAHTVEVQASAQWDTIEPTRLGRPYYLRPERGGLKPYVLLREALRRSGKVAVVKLAMRGREILALIRPHGDVLVLHQVHWADELRPAEGLAPPETVTVTDAEVTAATALMDAIGPADLEAERDEYQAAVDAVITAKLEGEPTPHAPVPEAPTVDLMAALRASLEDAERQRAKPGGKKSTAKKPTRRKASR